MTLRIYITGRVALEIDGQVVVDERRFREKQGRLVFAYLLCEQARPVPRDELARVVWQQDFPPSWEVALSALISRLQRILSSGPLEGRGLFLSRTLGQYQLNLPRDAWIDLEAGFSAIDRAESAIRTADLGGVLGPATVAATIARRSFLPGVKGEWVDSQNRRLQRQLVRALDCLCHMRLSSGEPALAVETAIEAVDLDPFREHSYQLLMQAYATDGNKAKALDVYHDLRKLLGRDLGTEPSAEIQALYLQLLD